MNLSNTEKLRKYQALTSMSPEVKTMYKGVMSLFRSDSVENWKLAFNSVCTIPELKVMFPYINKMLGGKFKHESVRDSIRWRHLQTLRVNVAEELLMDLEDSWKRFDLSFKSTRVEPNRNSKLWRKFRALHNVVNDSKTCYRHVDFWVEYCYENNSTSQKEYERLYKNKLEIEQRMEKYLVHHSENKK